MPELIEKKHCTGCAACVNACPANCIAMETDQEGFDYPRIDESKCLNCNLCRKVCPELHEPRKNAQQGACYAAWSVDDKIRRSSSSGGVFSVLANYVLAHDGVVCAAAFGHPDMQLCHMVIERKEELKPLCGSKYVQSSIGKVFRQIKKELQEKRMVLFVGTPCQVSGLKSFLGQERELLLTCDLVCHGVPSPGLFHDYLTRISDGNVDRIEDFYFRDLAGWSCETSIKIDGTVQKLQEKEYFLPAFLKGLLSRECCYNCRYTTLTRVADFTVADFWGIGSSHAFNYPMGPGISCVLVNTPKAEKVLTELKDQLFYVTRDVQETIKGGNAQFVHPSNRPAGRDEVFGDFYRLSPAEFMAKYKLKKSYWQKKISYYKVLFGGAKRRALKTFSMFFRR